MADIFEAASAFLAANQPIALLIWSVVAICKAWFSKVGLVKEKLTWLALGLAFVFGFIAQVKGLEGAAISVESLVQMIVNCVILFVETTGVYKAIHGK